MAESETTSPVPVPVAEPAHPTDWESRLTAILARQEADWALGRRTDVAQLATAFGDATDSQHAELLLELVYSEIVLREHAGEFPTLEEYQQRFPELADSLRVQWEIDRLITAQGEDESVASHESDLPGRYELQEEIGRGAIGVVSRAWDTRLKRVVAIKRLRAGLDAPASEIARFRQEAETIARIQHPNIVQIHDILEIDRLPSFAMEYCSGGSLAEQIQGRPLRPRTAARLVEQIARGIEAAHAAGIIHRDLKPANVLLDCEWAVDESSVASRRSTGTSSTHASHVSHSSHPSNSPLLPVPKITDFGLAKLLSSDSSATATGNILGTPAYMAPEQAWGDAKRVGPAADVYALGAVLYECLTGRPPFRGAGVTETLVQVRDQEPLRIKQLEPSVPIDLDTIAHKCLRKDPRQRYENAKELAQDLDRYLNYQPIRARRERPWEAAKRVARRYPWASALGLASALLLVLIALGSLLFAHRLNLARLESNRQRNLAFQARARAREALDAMTSSVASTTLLQQKVLSPDQEQFLKNVVTYYDEFSESNESDERSAELAAAAAYRAGVIHDRLGQKREALTKYRLAVRRFRILRERVPASATVLESLGAAFNALGHTYRDFGEFQRSASTFREGVEVMRSGIKDTGGSPNDWRKMAWLYHNLACVLGELGEENDERKALENTVNTYREMERQFPNFKEHEFERVLAYVSLAGFEYRNGNWQAARRYFRDSQVRLQSFVAKDPMNRDYAQRLGWCSTAYANALATMGDFSEAHQCLIVGIGTLSRVCQRYPGDVVVQKQLGYAYLDESSVYRTADQATRAISSADQAIEIFKQLAEDHPDSLELWEDLGQSQYLKALAALEARRNDEAILSLQQAIATYRGADEQGHEGVSDALKDAAALLSGLLSDGDDVNWELATKRCYRYSMRESQLAALQTAEASMWRMRIYGWLVRGADDLAVGELRSRAIPPETCGNSLYHWARAHALVARFSDDPSTREEFSERAVRLLIRIPEQDTVHKTHAKGEVDLWAVRSHPDFLQWLDVYEQGDRKGGATSGG